MLADVPTGWREARLRDHLCEIKQRVNPIDPAVRVLSVSNRHGLQDATETFSRQVYSEDIRNYKAVRRLQFAYNPSRINVGSIGMMRTAGVGAMSPMYIVFKAINGLEPSYFDHLVRTTRFNGLVRANLQGSVRSSLSFDALGAFAVPLPGCAEQRAIAGALDAVDATIAGTEALIKDLSIAKNAVMRDLLTLGPARGRAGMRHLDEHWVMGRIAEGITEIPDNWRLVYLVRVAKLESGHTPDRTKPEYWSGDIPWISLSDMPKLEGSSVGETSETVSMEGIRGSSARLLPAGTVVLSRTAVIGKASLMARPMATSQDFANWVCSSLVEPRYLLQVFRQMDREWRRLQAGSSPTNKTLYMHVFERLQILLPPIEEQRVIADVAEAFDQRIEAERVMLAELHSVKAALAQELLAGRVRLPAAMITRHDDGASTRAVGRGAAA